jgi:hypothetical protein
VILFPGKSDSYLQALDLGRAQRLVQKAVSYMERNHEMKLNVLQAMHMLLSAWNAVRPKIIVYYLKKADFSCNDGAALDVDLSHV